MANNNSNVQDFVEVQGNNNLDCLLSLTTKGSSCFARRTSNPGGTVQDDKSHDSILLLNCICKHEELTADPVEGWGYLELTCVTSIQRKMASNGML